MRIIKITSISDALFNEVERRKLNESICKRPKRLPVGWTPMDAAEHYEKCANASMDNWKIHEAGIYFEWAKIEREKCGKSKMFQLRN